MSFEEGKEEDAMPWTMRGKPVKGKQQ